MSALDLKSIASPEESLGFEVGADRRLADWPQIVEYFTILDGASPRVQTREIGKTTEGSPFLAAMISSPENLADAERLLAIQSKLADPRTIEDEDEAEALIAAGKVVVAVTCSIHAIEVGATQMSLLLGHHLAASDDHRVKRILDNVVLLLVPCLNPDGLRLVKGWYDSTLGTRFEGVTPPFLYHKYAGHDNNRDWFMFTQDETRLVVEHILNRWHPHILYDLHQTRSAGMRMILPPFVDPVGPNVDPILQSEIATLGTAIAGELTAQGKPGIAVNVVYDAYSPSRSYQHYHGGIRILSEAASVHIATPVQLQQGQLRTARGEHPTRKSWNHPMPWQGGRWSLRDIVDYELAAVMACLDNAARHRDTWIRNSHMVNKRATTSRGNPHAFLIPRDQRDPNTATELLRVMRTAAVEVHEAEGPFVADGRPFPAGTRVVFSAQPYGSFARTMMEVQPYPNIRQYPGGPPKAPYDVTAHNLPLQMGVEVIEVKAPFEASVRPVADPGPPAGTVVRRGTGAAAAYLLRPETNASARAVNRLLASGAEVGRARRSFEAEGNRYAPGTFVVNGGVTASALLSSVAEDESVTFDALTSMPAVAQLRLNSPRIGIYKSYVPTTEEGWTRFVFDGYGFSYTSLVDGDIREGGLAERFDAVLLPHQMVRQMHQGHGRSHYPARYAGGLGEPGAGSLRDFVERGGTIIAWDGAARYALQHLDLPVTNVLAGLPHSDFFAPGCLLGVQLDTNHPIAYGMPEEAAAMFVNGPAFDVGSGTVVGEYASVDPLLSGLLIGPDRIRGKAAVATVPAGRGEVILIGFRVHFRAQARGTYKILFNSLYRSAAQELEA